MIRGKPLRWWLIRLLGAGSVPVLCMAVCAGLVWITEHGRHFWLSVLVLLAAVPLLANLGLAPTWMWMDAFAKRAPGCLFSLLHLTAAAAACGLTWFSYELWALDWWGVETTCDMLDVRERGEVRDVNGDISTVTVYDAALRCADAGAPELMTTETPVSGERVTVVYDPAGNLAPRPAIEVEASRVRAAIAAAAAAAWALLLLALMLLSPPEDDNDLD